MVILAEILVQSYNGTKTIPFSVLEKQWKADDQIPDRGEIKQEHAALPQLPTLWNKDGRAKKCRISWTSYFNQLTLTYLKERVGPALEMPFDLKVPRQLPEGASLIGEII